MDDYNGFRPLNDRLLVRRKVEEVAETPGGLVIPDQAREKPAEGVILATGRGRILDNGQQIPLQVRVGDTVVFGKYAGTDVKLGEEDLFILREDEILGVQRAPAATRSWPQTIGGLFRELTATW